MAKFKNRVLMAQVKAADKIKDFVSDVRGSDTTEKVGMVLAAAIIVGLLIAAVHTKMPDLFDSVFGKVGESLEVTP